MSFCVEGTYKYVEQIVMNSRQVVHHLREFAMNWQPGRWVIRMSRIIIKHSEAGQTVTYPEADFYCLGDERVRPILWLNINSPKSSKLNKGTLESVCFSYVNIYCTSYLQTLVCSLIFQPVSPNQLLPTKHIFVWWSTECLISWNLKIVSGFRPIQCVSVTFFTFDVVC